MIIRSGRRTQAGAMLVLIFALVSSARWVQKVVRGYEELRAPDEISAYERRLEPLRAHLPRQGVVGYLSDPVPREPSLAEGRADYKKYLLTQYALTPLLVRRSPSADLVVGNFHESSSAAQAPGLGLAMVADFGNGTVLFSRGPAE